jgi:hypothetical protein
MELIELYRRSGRFEEAKNPLLIVEIRTFDQQGQSRLPFMGSLYEMYLHDDQQIPVRQPSQLGVTVWWNPTVGKISETNNKLRH